ncbi:hypothetical protein [Portibacter marinus]|uniref:hypothetical protein n=1 Tax=Portibacter marinus TaxID=2898660 RepID=UPI001F3D6A6E|nr:hypothetical protein [Portibacter marinus]
MKNIFILQFAFLIILISCTKEIDEAAADYFPLHVGNEWDYIKGLQVLIDVKETINGKEYFRFIESYDTGTDTSYYRNERNKIYKTTGNGHEYLLFDLEKRVGKHWKLSFTPDTEFEYKAEIQDKNYRLETSNHTFENCYHFYYDFPDAIDDEFSIFLAPGIGIVQEQGQVRPESGLNRVIIDGEETFF